MFIANTNAQVNDVAPDFSVTVVFRHLSVHQIELPFFNCLQSTRLHNNKATTTKQQFSNNTIYWITSFTLALNPMFYIQLFIMYRVFFLLCITLFWQVYYLCCQSVIHPITTPNLWIDKHVLWKNYPQSLS